MINKCMQIVHERNAVVKTHAPNQWYPSVGWVKAIRRERQTHYDRK